MEKINFDYVKQAARVFDRIYKIRRCITRDRFAEVAKTCFKLTDEHQQDMLYGLLNITPKMVHYLATAVKTFAVTSIPMNPANTQLTSTWAVQPISSCYQSCWRVV